MISSIHYKFKLENSSKIRLKKFAERNNYTISPKQNDDDILQQLQLCIDSLNSKIYCQSLDYYDQNGISENTTQMILFLLLEKPIIDNFFEQFINEQFLLKIFDTIQCNISKLSVLLLYEILYKKKFIKKPELFTDIFVKYFFETTLFEEDEEIKICFSQTVTNLLLCFEKVYKVFNKRFMDHFSEVIKTNTEEDCILSITTLYFEILQNFNGFDFNDEITDFEFFDFLEDYITSLDLTNINVQHSIIRFLVDVSQFDFFIWLYQEPYIQTICNQLIENSYEDNNLFVLVINLGRINNTFVHIIKVPLFQVVLFKINELIEIQNWTDDENYIAKKIIKGLHLLWKLNNTDMEDSSYDDKINVLYFLSNIYDKSSFALKDKALYFVSVFIQKFFSAQMPIDAMNLISEVFIKCIDLDCSDSKFMLFSGFHCFFNQMQKTEIYEDFVNAFIQNNAVECLRDALAFHSFDDDVRLYAMQFLEIFDDFNEEE